MTAVDRRGNPVDALADLFDSLDTHVTAANRHARLDEGNRLTLLFGHGIFGVLVGPGFALLVKSGMAAPSFVILRHIPGAPISLAAWITVAGAVLAVATFRRQRIAEYWALAAMAAWYLITATSYVGAIALWLATPGPPDWTHAPTLFAQMVYLHLAYALLSHMRTLRRKGLRRDPP